MNAVGGKVRTENMDSWMRGSPTIRHGLCWSPFGTVRLGVWQGCLVSLLFCDERTSAEAFQEQWLGVRLVEDQNAAESCASGVFGEHGINIPADGVALIGTEFQHQVWLELLSIPFADVQTYGDVARRIGRPSSVRAVATAIGRNSIALVVPCHRVLASGGIGGYRWGQARKRAVLEWESTRRSDPVIGTSLGISFRAGSECRDGRIRGEFHP